MIIDTKEMDIVYFLKPSTINEELRYSLRSLKNLPHRKVFLIGGRANWAKNVHSVGIRQFRGNKWLNVSDLLFSVVNNPTISDDFIWFNDDFYVITPQQGLQYWHDRTLEERIEDFTTPKRYTSTYGRRLQRAAMSLQGNKRSTRNFELHLPMVTNRARMSVIFHRYPEIGAKRSLYCNEFNLPSTQRDDVKVYGLEEHIHPNADFASTDDRSFSYGVVGEDLKRLFPNKCIYEI